MTDVELKRSALLAFLVQNSPLLISDQTLNIVHFEFKNWHSLLILLNHVLLALNAIQHFFLGCDFGSFLSAPRFDFIIGCQTQIVSLSEQESSFTNRNALFMLSFSLRSAFTFSNYLENSQKEHISKIELSILHKRSILSAFQDFTGLITSY